MKRRPAVIAYDIECHRTRREVHRVLREWRLTAPEAEELFIQFAGAIDRDRDRLLLAWLAGHRPALARGRGRVDALSCELLAIG